MVKGRNLRAPARRPPPPAALRRGVFAAPAAPAYSITMGSGAEMLFTLKGEPGGFKVTQAT